MIPSIKINLCNPILLITGILITLSCYSQKPDSASKVYRSSTLKIAYTGSIVYPGVRGGIDLPIKTTHVTVFKNPGKQKDYFKDRSAIVNLGWYHHPGFHDNLYLTAGWTMRRLHSRGFFTEFSPEAGISRTFLSGISYQVDNLGNVRKKSKNGYYYALLSLSGGAGYDFELTQNLPFGIFMKFSMLMMFPYNSTIYLRPVVEIGISCKPSHFLTLKVRSGSKHK